MRTLTAVLFLSLSTLALGETPDILGNVNGTVVNPFIENARFEFTWGTISNCQQSKSNWWFLTCDAAGTMVKLIGPTGKTSKITFDKCYIMANNDPALSNRQFVFNGTYTEEGAGLHVATKGQLILSYDLATPTDVRGKFVLKDYEIAYALAGSRKVDKGDRFACAQHSDMISCNANPTCHWAGFYCAENH
jgi:hypothetical protein